MLREKGPALSSESEALRGCGPLLKSGAEQGKSPRPVGPSACLRVARRPVAARWRRGLRVQLSADRPDAPTSSFSRWAASATSRRRRWMTVQTGCGWRAERWSYAAGRPRLG